MSTENGSLNLKQRFLYREEICMINYLEHHTPWENSEDKSEHIISMSFILCTFGAHIHICLHPLNKGKQGSSIARFVIISVLERNLSKHVSPGICNALYFSPYTGIPYPYWTNTVKHYWLQRKQAMAPGGRAFTFLSSECRIYPPQCRVFRKRQKRAGW